MKLVVDSTCDLPETLMEEHDIRRIPLRVQIGETDYRDGEEISLPAVYGHMRQGVLPKTAQPRPEDIRRVFEECLAAGHDVLYLAFSEKLSGTCASARLLARDLAGEYRERTIRVLDTRSGSLAIGLLALQAARRIARGRDLETVCRQVLALREHIEHLFFLSSLDWLVKGGRLPQAAGYVGGRLRIHPLLEMKKGKIVLAGAVRGRRKAVQTLLSRALQRIGDRQDQEIGIAHGDDLEAALDLERRIREACPSCRTLLAPIGAVLGSHLGIGGVGLLFFNEGAGELVTD